MRTTGMVRRIDEFGRIVLPKELRRALNFNVKDLLEILVEDECIILRKYESKCILCRSPSDLIVFGGKKICCNCVQQIKQEKVN